MKELLIKLESPNPSVRNDAAIALMDMGNPDAVPFLIAAIDKPGNRNARGTLIYALSAFDCSGLFTQLFRWAVEGGFEASCESVSIINEQKLSPATADLSVCEKMLSSLSVNRGDPELVVELEYALYRAAR